MVLFHFLQRNIGVDQHNIQMLEQFPFQLSKACTDRRFDIFNLGITDGALI